MSLKTPVKKKPSPRYDNMFKAEWCVTHSFIKPSRKGKLYAFCEPCRAAFSISHAGYGNITRHIGCEKHKANVRAVQNTSSLTMFSKVW